MRRLTILSVLAFIMTAAPAAASNISMSHVVLRGLDKLTGRISTMTVAVGQKAQFGILDVYVRVCYTHPPEEIPENAAFLEIVEKKDKSEQKVFSGWMFSSSPALSAMEHPVYDIWVLKCQGQPKIAPAPTPLVLKTVPDEEKPVEKPAAVEEKTVPEEQETPDEPTGDDISEDDIADIEDSVIVREETDDEGESTEKNEPEITGIVDDKED